MASYPEPMTAIETAGALIRGDYLQPDETGIPIGCPTQ